MCRGIMLNVLVLASASKYPRTLSNNEEKVAAATSRHITPSNKKEEVQYY